jgi:tetratricopeptide (TPR) repeat protein
MNEAERLVAEGLALEDEGDAVKAEEAYRAATAENPAWSVPHYNLGLLCKYQLRWQESLEFNRTAAALAPEDEAAWWNLGIAATALGNWSEARRAWKACGLEPPPGDGAPDFGFGPTPVRLDPNGDAEVIWTERIDPARARIVSIPLPWSAHNFGDIVLTDGAAEGDRMVGDQQYPVFNALALLSASPLKKYVIELATADPAVVEVLVNAADELNGAAEDWGRSTNILCAECSRGTPHEHPSGSNSPAHPHCGLAASDDRHAEAIIRAWLDREPKADLVRWYDAQ